MLDKIRPKPEAPADDPNPDEGEGLEEITHEDAEEEEVEDDGVVGETAEEANA